VSQKVLGYAEYFDQSGTPREHLRPLVEYLLTKCAGQGEAMRATVRARLREQEVSYNLLGTPGGSARPWRVDEVPHIVGGTEFDELAKNLNDRVNLLSACLQDFYGDARLLKDGVIPSELVLGNPNYYRPLRNLPQLGSTRLILYAADLVRETSGTYVVHSDRTASPTGAGYALENRLVIGQLLGELFVDLQVQKVNAFFRQMRDALEALTPRTGYAPRIVVLTPGNQDESSFEHAYMARYQGFELVEGRDLTVRGDEVFLKTLEGLKPVDVILRRITDGYCDPLELRDDSFIGVAGLLSAVRAGKVGVANPLGSGLIESPAFRAYLPDIARALGKPIGLESVPTRYLGDARHVEEVFDTFDAWRIRPAYHDRRQESPLVAELSKKDKELLRTAVREGGTRLVAERWPLASAVPVGAEMSRTGALSMRFFACHNGRDYTVMPGALGRVDDTPDGLFLLPGPGATSKDVWVVGTRTSEPPTLPRMPEPALNLRRGGINVPSRLFDDLYWLGRYAARATSETKLLRVGIAPFTKEANETSPEVSAFLVRTLRTLRMIGAKEVELEAGLVAAIDDTNGDNAITACLERIHWLTSQTRSRLSIDTWNCLRRISAWTQAWQNARNSALSAGPARFTEILTELDNLYFALAAFHGITTSSMVRGPAWIFVDGGRRLEQGVFVFSLLEAAFRDGSAKLPLETMLISCDSLMTYRARYLSSLQPAPAVDLILTDATNPQSVIYQVQRLLTDLRSLPQENSFPLSRAHQELIKLETRLLTMDLFELTKAGHTGVIELAEWGIQALWQVSDALTQSYFVHASPVRVFGSAEPLDGEAEIETHAGL
jgi:uncharacterized circularly permuted ATP-grasp superfamily protein/uncharacterized alpha-E superfamily protein